MGPGDQRMVSFWPKADIAAQVINVSFKRIKLNSL
jgi:hypothetical protein